MTDKGRWVVGKNGKGEPYIAFNEVPVKDDSIIAKFKERGPAEQLMAKMNDPTILDSVKNTEWDHVIVSVSGGKDSAVLMKWACENFPKEKLVAVHAEIDIDWDETLPTVLRQCEFYGLPLEIVQAVDMKKNKKGFLDHLLSPRINRKTKEVGEQMFPSKGQRWCTSVLKIGPINKYATSLRGNVLVLIGERWQESQERAMLEAVRPDKNLTKASVGRTVVKCSPILDMLETEVWEIIEKDNIPTHPCYAWGVSRASCAICIFSSDSEILIAAKRAPHIVKRYIEAESKIQHTFKYKKTKKDGVIKETIRSILKKQGFNLADLHSGEVPESFAV